MTFVYELFPRPFFSGSWEDTAVCKTYDFPYCMCSLILLYVGARPIAHVELYVVSTRSAFSDGFAAQYASCLFYRADNSAVREDARGKHCPSAGLKSKPISDNLKCPAHICCAIEANRRVCWVMLKVRGKRSNSAVLLRKVHWPSCQRRALYVMFALSLQHLVSS